MAKLQWILDETTAHWANKLPIAIKANSPLPQYDGREYRGDPQTWSKHILSSSFPAFCIIPGSNKLLPSPDNIMGCFKTGLVLEGLALVIMWGGSGMVRNKNDIYAPSLQDIDHTLQRCLQTINEQNSIAPSWNMLVNGLAWTDVITSKVLHFMTRLIGYENPSVPIDVKVILKEVWPRFKQSVIDSEKRPTDPKLPDRWRKGNGWEPYNRYMTAVICWSNIMGWTTTQLENTIYREYTPPD